MIDTKQIPWNLVSTAVPDPNGERFERFLEGRRFRLERITTIGQVTPADSWYDQAQAEWVLVLSGHARLQFKDRPGEVSLHPGDSLYIAPHRLHRVSWSDPEQPTVWLALHFDPVSANQDHEPT